MANILKEELRRRRRMGMGMMGPGMMENRDYDYDYPRGYGRERFGYQGDYMEMENEPTWTYYEEDWTIPGPFTGVGPRGYTRADERILDDIIDRLTQHGRINASEIIVQVEHGEVTLDGTVDNRRAKRIAEDVVESVAGVKDVHNQMHVKQLSSEQTPSG